MIELNFSPKNKEIDPDSVEDEPIPTYEEWLDEGAEVIFSHPGFFLAKAAIGLVKHLWTRERLLVNLLIQKDVIQQHEVNEFLGPTMHKNTEKEGVKELTKTLMRAASQGKLIGPSGKPADPDSVLVMLNDILDLNDTGWNGRTVEIIADMVGDKDLRSDYEKETKLRKHLNKQRAAKRERQANNERLAAERKAKNREERERKVMIYVSQCRVFEQDVPSDEDQQRMVEGEIPIPIPKVA